MNGQPAAWALAWLLVAAPCRGSEDEAWVQRAAVPAETTPLLALVVDTSAAMSSPLEVLPPYDPGHDYTAGDASGCRPDRLYWRLGAGPPPDCAGTQWISLHPGTSVRGWQCEAGRTALDADGVFVAARAAQWEARGTGGFWRALVPGQDGAVECIADRGLHGSSAGSWFAADGEGGPWRTAPDREPDWHAPPLADAYLFVTGNYLAYLRSSDRVRSTRYDWLVRRINAAARATGELDIAVARFSHDGLGGDEDARGGMLALPPTRLPAGAVTLGTLLASWEPGGPAPVAETLTELVRWLRGDPVGFGDTSQQRPGTPFPSAPGARLDADPSRYRTPFDHACRPVLAAIATAGRPAADAGAASAVRALPGLGTIDCGADCASTLTGLLAQGDLVEALPGVQRSGLHWLLPSDADPALRDAARSGDGGPVDLDDPWSLFALAAEVMQQDAAAGAAWRVSAAGLETRPFAVPDAAAYFALSRPAPGRAWPGNLRRYGLAPTEALPGTTVAVDRDGEPAFDPSGRLRGDSWSEWSDARDGTDPLLGGAVSRVPDWDQRRLFSDLSDAPLTDPRNRLAAGNPLLTRERLGLVSADARGPAELADWLLGRDVFDADGDGDAQETRRALGDAGLRSPRVLRYAQGGTGLAFLATNDGILHAFEADTGTERWAFIPAALLPQTAGRAAGNLRFNRLHGLDGPVELMLHDANRDGRLDARDGDQAWLFLALGRGGTGYYGLDVTDPDGPRLLWHLDATTLPGFAQSWPAPVPARMRLDPAMQGDDPRVVVLAGGYDPAEDARAAPARSLGATLAVVAAATGDMLWRASGPADPGADLEVPGLHRSLPAAPRVLDTDGDGLHDRAYVLGIDGQLYRFDLATSAEPNATIAVQAIADLGTPAGPGEPRRFQVTPDAILATRHGRQGLVLAFGSGWSSRPRSRGSVDRFYAVFDTLHDAAPPGVVDETDLTDVTEAPGSLPPDASGWMYRLVAHGDGEKVTGNSLTFDHRVRFTTYQPVAGNPSSPCGPPAGIARLYTLDIRDGSPAQRGPDRPDPDQELDLEGLAPALRVSFPASPRWPACTESACRRTPQGLLGGRVIPLDFSNDPVRTSWRQLDADAE